MIFGVSSAGYWRDGRFALLKAALDVAPVGSGGAGSTGIEERRRPPNNGPNLVFKSAWSLSLRVGGVFDHTGTKNERLLTGLSAKALRRKPTSNCLTTTHFMDRIADRWVLNSLSVCLVKNQPNSF